AVCGTALTEQQLALLKRYTDNVMICFDADLAGQSANLRGLNLAWSLGFNLKIVNLGSAKDPDELIKKDFNLWQEALRTAQPLMDYVFAQTLKVFDITRPDHKKTAARKLVPYLNYLSDAVELAHYVKKLADWLSVPIATIQSLLSNKKSEQNLVAEVMAATTSRPLGLERKLGERFLALLLLKPEGSAQGYEQIDPDMLVIEDLVNLYKYLQIYYNEHNKLPDQQVALQSSLDSENLIALELLAQTILAESPETISQELLSVSRRLQQAFWQKKLNQIQAAIAQAEQEKNNDRLAILSQEYSVITNQLKQLP
ncbi:MAG: toprim domain-containing protein, partial [Candidatus Komeilibacteria bacterium]|nr:toprim domain-containing protein [Candidatus Komeilibacteria bacterium]